MPILVPGIGAQGGDVQAVLRNGKNAQGAGLIISSSRAILYAGSGEDFAQAARGEARKLRDEINRWR
jgi:orotidine-5'-phosphate decarboxylase